MKKVLILLGVAALIATGCQSTNDSGPTPAASVAPATGSPYPPSPNTMNNPPSTVAPPAPPAPH